MDLSTLPDRMSRLPLDSAGRPVPFFVEWIDGKPDFRVTSANALARAISQRLCWVCAQPLGSQRATFVIGPMCAVNRTSSEPPSHRDCAVWSATHCPFLANPDKVRREANLPTGYTPAAGTAITRNPGVTLCWTTRYWSWFRAPGGAYSNAGILCRIGEPERVVWYAEGRDATRAEVLASIESGLPALVSTAKQQDEDEANGGKAIAALNVAHALALAYVPA
jgi:hypothetical protein